MIKFNYFRVVIYALISLTILSCSSNEDDYELITFTDLEIQGEVKASISFQDNEGPHEHSFSEKRSDGFTETFESGSKGSYAGGSVNLSNSGSWYFSDALIGSLSRDRKYGAKSVRIRNTGYITMSFNMDNGAELIRVRHAKYGSDGSSSWRLIVSYDNGANWSYVGSTITTSSTSLNTVTFTVNETSSVRYGIYKISGGSNRINIDNIEIVTGSTTGGGGGGNGIPSQDSNITFGNPNP